MLILKPSKIQGVGIFTTTKIKKGMIPLLFFGDWIFKKRCTGRQRHFCVSAKGGYWCPKNYYRMSIGWYLNHSDKPNCSSATRPKTLHHIQAGEELTIDYSKL